MDVSEDAAPGRRGQEPAYALRPLADVHHVVRTAADPRVREEGRRVAREAYAKSRDFEAVDLPFVREYLDGKMDICALTPLSSASTRPPHSASHETWLWKLRRLKLAWGRVDGPGERDARVARLADLMQELVDLQALAAKYA